MGANTALMWLKSCQAACPFFLGFDWEGDPSVGCRCVCVGCGCYQFPVGRAGQGRAGQSGAKQSRAKQSLSVDFITGFVTIRGKKKKNNEGRNLEMTQTAGC